MPQGQTLAGMVRAKYPGAYDDLSDQQLETQVKAKFPGVYDDIPTTQAQPERPDANAATGFAKGLLSRPLAYAVAGGELLHKIPGVSRAVDAIYGTPGLSEAAFLDTNKQLEPKSTAQAVGAFTGDVASAFVPAGLVTKGAKAAAAALPLVRGSSVARPLVRGAVEAAGGAGLAAAQGGDPTLGGVVGGTLGTLSGAVGQVASKLKKSGEASMIAALGPAGRGSGPSGTNQVEMAKKLAPGLLEKGFRAGSHESALVKVGEAIDAASSKVDDIMTSLPTGTRVRTQPIIDTLLLVKRQGQVKGVSVGAGKVSSDVIDSVVKDLRQIGPSMTPQDAVKFRQKIGPLAKWQNLVGNAEEIRAQTYKDIYNGIRGSIENLDPNIRGANKELSFWLNTQDLLERSSRRPQPPSSGTSGAILGAMTGTTVGPWGVIGAAMVGRQMQRLMRSPGWRFVSANVKDDIANAILKRDMGRFNQLAAVAAAQAGGE